MPLRASAAAARSILGGAQGTVDAAVTTLLNALAGVAADVVLVLDDFHVIESPAVHEQVGYLLEHLPHGATSSSGPARIRRSRSLGSGREAGWSRSGRATSGSRRTEAASYLEVMGLSLTDDNVATLEARTEGWIAALQLAALSLQGRTDATEFIAAFAGDDRYIVDYLVEEVLRRQPAETRDFLLKTSILSRFTGPLCGRGHRPGRGESRRSTRSTAATCSSSRSTTSAAGTATTTSSEACSRPISPRNGRRGLRAPPSGERMVRAERRSRRGDRALPSGPEIRSERPISWSARCPAMRGSDASRPCAAGWIRSRATVVARRPVLAVAYVGAILSANEVDRVAELLDAAERQVTPQISAQSSSTRRSSSAFRRRSSCTERRWRRCAAIWRGTWPTRDGCSTSSGKTDHIGRGGAAAFLGLAYWEMGDLEAGYGGTPRAWRRLERPG